MLLKYFFRDSCVNDVLIGKEAITNQTRSLTKIANVEPSWTVEHDSERILVQDVPLQRLLAGQSH